MIFLIGLTEAINIAVSAVTGRQTSVIIVSIAIVIILLFIGTFITLGSIMIFRKHAYKTYNINGVDKTKELKMSYSEDVEAQNSKHCIASTISHTL